MKTKTKLLALLLALALLLSFAACLEDSTKDGEASPTAEATAGTETAEIDRSLPAIKLGNTVVTVGDIADAYDYFVYYMSYYGYSAPTAADEIAQYRDMMVDDALQNAVLPWQAEVQGLTLTSEQIADIEAQVEENKQSIYSDYLESAKDELGETATEEELAAHAYELIEADVQSYYGYSFDEYLADVNESLTQSALATLVEEKFKAAITVDEAAAEEWYNTELAAQKEACDADPSAYETTASDFDTEASVTPALYVPEGYVQVQVLTVSAATEDDEAYNANVTEMAALEAEYGSLILSNSDAARQAEIKARFAELTAANDAITAESRQKAVDALAAAQIEGADFGAIMAEYGTEEVSDSVKANGSLLYTLSQDADYSEAVWTAACALTEEGQLSEVIADGNVFYVIRLVKAVPAGEIAFADAKELCMAAALASKQDEEWTAIQADWLTEARNAAEFFEDNYANVGVSAE